VKTINIVWLKRDLRLSDHAPLYNAQKTGHPLLLLYIVEPMLLNDEHYDRRHWRFIWQSIKDLNTCLLNQGAVAGIQVMHGDAVGLFEHLATRFSISQLFSHQEIGLKITYQRDRAIKAWCHRHRIDWLEYPTGAVQRGLKNRTQWDKSWSKTMRAPIENVELNQLNLVALPTHCCWQPPHYWQSNSLHMQMGGTSAAWETLTSFFDVRGQAYHRQISSPSLSRESCSRMSPYLAWGNISLREMYQQLLQHWQRPGWRRALAALSSRLHWHCHFIQKFESECGMEERHINRGYENFPYRQGADAAADLAAWQQGNTGIPMIDACMRCLHQTGYINFRMRAMLVSFLSHHLLIDWRRGVKHLARLFLDFEPGIHYAQFQMQAGVTGANTIRIYNPTKQAKEQDPQGYFLRKWLPELSELPNELLFEPWLTRELEQQMFKISMGRDYSFPIVDLIESGKKAREQLWSWRTQPAVKADAARIIAQHVRPGCR